MACKGTTRECLLPLVKLAMVVLTIPMPDLCAAGTVDCSEPTQPALLKALNPLFELSAIRPVNQLQNCTNIHMSFTLYGILGVNEKSQLLITYLWLDYHWLNEFVNWDQSVCGSDKISLPREKLWMPDIVINEFMDKNTAPNIPYVQLHSDGMVYDAHPAKVVSSCLLDIYTFPFDVQNCTLTFNSYFHYEEEIKLFLEKAVENITKHSKEIMTTMGEWELLSITSGRADRGPQWIDKLVFHISVRRRPTMYVVNLLIPSIFLITLDLFSFLLPPQSVDRSAFKMTLILGYTVFLLIMNDLLPITGNTIPLINVFFCLCLAMMVASLLETIFITNLLGGPAKVTPVPRWIQVFVLQILGCLVGLPRKAKQSGKDMEQSAAVGKPDAGEGAPEDGAAAADEAVQELRSLSRELAALRLTVEQQIGGNQSSEDWMQVGFIFDRLLFGLYILFISVSFTAIVVIWWKSYHM